ncbi:hypothetical protein N665_0205s0026 [Sinapis alba]|nr:hypothetical protein N665_0205s0026 [Sinapis alba]
MLPETNDLVGGGINAVANRLCIQTWLRVSQRLHTTSQVVVGSVYFTLWYITWSSLVLQAFASSFPVQIALFMIIAAASALGSAVHVLLNWFKEERRQET